MNFMETVDVDLSGKNITFKGGYQIGFGPQTDMTSISKLTLLHGTVTVDRLTVK
jgi:hypothetical protein